MGGALGYRRKRREGRDISGQRFGRLVALHRVGQDKWNSYVWLCQCDCGQTSRVRTSGLTSEGIRSCGCLRPLAPWMRAS